MSIMAADDSNKIYDQYSFEFKHVRIASPAYPTEACKKYVFNSINSFKRFAEGDTIKKLVQAELTFIVEKDGSISGIEATKGRVPSENE